MSDLMLFGVLSMPLNLAMADDFSIKQFHGRAQEAVARIKSDAERIEQLERDLAKAVLSSIDAECLRVGQQIQRAAETLPDMFNIVIDVENGCAGVKLFNNEGDEFDFETDSVGLSYTIEKAIDAAISTNT